MCIETESGLKNTLKGTRKEIVDMVLETPTITIPQVSERLGPNVRGVAKHFKNLQEQEIIKHIGLDNGGHWEVVEEDTI